MFYVRYVLAELRRRKARTVLTALGLGVGVGLVVAVTSLSSGLSDAQSQVLKPLTGVGTDMSVSRPIIVNRSGGRQTFAPGAGGGLSSAEQEQLRKENSSLRLNFNNQGEAGQRSSTRNFVSTDLSFPASEATKVNSIQGVKAIGVALTLNQIAVSGTVPQNGQSNGPRGFGGPGGGGSNTRFSQSSVTGINASQSALAPLTPSQIVKGKYLPVGDGNNAVVSQTYAQNQNFGIGDTVKVGSRSFKIVGIAKAPLGGKTSDIYIPLSTLQKVSKRIGRINVLQVRAVSASNVDGVAKQIKQTFSGAQVTTASDLANRVGGSLVDAKNLSSKLGTALAIVALLAAFAIASLLTLTSVSKRTRELGTLKAIGWRQALVIRQICGESVAQGFMGGVVGAVLGFAVSAAIGASGWTLQASVAQVAQQPAPAAFGQGAVQAGSSTVTIGAPIDATAVILAIALAMLGGLVAGGVGSARAARLSPAEALRSVE